jgi:hypothetical protein
MPDAFNGAYQGLFEPVCPTSQMVAAAVQMYKLQWGLYRMAFETCFTDAEPPKQLLPKRLLVW